MNPLDIKRKLFEIQRVETAKMEMELKIFEKMEEIDRLKANMEVQDRRINELKTELEQAKA